MTFTNPFSFDTFASGENFCNRKSEIKELVSEIQSSHNVIIFSQRRYGKTSLIKKVLEMAKKQGILIIYMDLFHVLNEEDFVKTYAKTLASAIEGSVDKVMQVLKSIFTSLRPKIDIAYDGSPEFTFGMENGRDPVMDLEEVLESVKKLADKKKSKAVVVFDEFQQIGQLSEFHRVESIIRNHIQSHTKISYIFMGSKKHLIFDQFNDSKRPLYESGKMFPLGKIYREDLADFVFSRFKSTNKHIPGNVASRLVDICESHPYYTQYVSHNLWEFTSSHATIADSDLDKAISLTINRASPRYESVWELLPIRQKQALIALGNLNTNEKLFSGNVIHHYNLTSASSFRKALKALFEKSLVDRDQSVFSIIDVFFKKWIQMNFPIE
ncbi:MAG: ATP-binding protein [Deltaproteobacteria bacterium]|nr:ATP-binding protein [Deltaproteobacteria bacterium]